MQPGWMKQNGLWHLGGKRQEVRNGCQGRLLPWRSYPIMLDRDHRKLHWPSPMLTSLGQVSLRHTTWSPMLWQEAPPYILGDHTKSIHTLYLLAICDGSLLPKHRWYQPRLSWPLGTGSYMPHDTIHQVGWYFAHKVQMIPTYTVLTIRHWVIHAPWHQVGS